MKTSTLKVDVTSEVVLNSKAFRSVPLFQSCLKENDLKTKEYV